MNISKLWISLILPAPYLRSMIDSVHDLRLFWYAKCMDWVILRSGRRFDQHFKYLQQVSSTHFGRRYFPIWGEDTCWRYSGDQIWWRYLFFELKDTSQSLGWPFHSLWGDQRYLKFRIWWRYLNVSYCPKNRDLISEPLLGLPRGDVHNTCCKPFPFLQSLLWSLMWLQMVTPSLVGLGELKLGGSH